MHTQGSQKTQAARVQMVLCYPPCKKTTGTLCSGIRSAPHAEGLGFNLQCVQLLRRCKTANTETIKGIVSDSVSDRLMRWARNILGSARRGSNPLGVALRNKQHQRSNANPNHQRMETALGTWCSGISSALHAEGPGFNPKCAKLAQARMRNTPAPNQCRHPPWGSNPRPQC